MSSSEDDAVQKFMATPELVEKLLLPFLDPGSTKHLAEAHGLTLEAGSDGIPVPDPTRSFFQLPDPSRPEI